MGLSQPSTHFEQQIAVPHAAVLLNRGSPIPALDPLDPYRINAVSGISESRVPVPPVKRLLNHTEMLKRI